MAIKIYSKTESRQLSENFSLHEFCCKGNGCCKTLRVDEALVSVLQNIRKHFGAPVTINSAYRCSKHNKAVGGVSGSYHTKGMAADIVVKGVEPKAVAAYAESIGVKGIGLYDTFVHVDTRENKSFWYGDAMKPKDTFIECSKIKQWQTAAILDGYKLKYGADGIWGNECEALAKSAICKKQIIGYKNRNLVKIIQAAVGAKVDGKFGNDTKNFVLAYQKRYALVADGVVGYNTWKKILGVTK